MKKLGDRTVMNTADPRENKAAIDGIFKTVNPDYLMILGAPDVVPHQDLDNPAYEPPDDDDQHAWGDVPHACDAPYSRDPANFVGPTRVVGRLPDLVGANEPPYIIGLLKTAAGYRRRCPMTTHGLFWSFGEGLAGLDPAQPEQYFRQRDKVAPLTVVGAEISWRTATRQDAFHQLSWWSCVSGVPRQKGKSYPTSPSSRTTVGQIVDGAVVGVGCCYGGELYDSITLGIDQPICQYFLLNILDGASLGRAALLARQQQFVERTAQMDPIDLKTLAQFCLLGDPSVHPVAGPSATNVPRGVAAADATRFFRAERRAKLRQTGELLRKTKPTASKRVAPGKLSPTTMDALSNIANLAGLRSKRAFTAFAVQMRRVRKVEALKQQRHLRATISL